ncbi:DUF3696 domain-containing protein [Micromonospora sp. NPDC051925]|uniref:DUF3696 domain-containing protein n=1 Tax=Micromonospora sp. NPDC051925 TaxID=3364288 RepID=UPI0037CA040E
MPLSKIVLENYRCFRDRQEIELAPVTVVLGKNNSGKSVLTRAPLVIATGFGTANTAPLDLDWLLPVPVDGFPDLIFEQSTHGRFTLGAEVDGPTPFAIAASIRYVDEDRAAYVSSLRLTVEDDDIDFQLRPTIEVTDRGLMYEIHRQGHLDVTRPVTFAGLLPRGDNIADLWPHAEKDLWLGPIRFLSAYRTWPERQHRLPIGKPRAVGEQGQGVHGILADDQARGSGELIDRVNDLLAHIVPEWRIEEIPVGPLWSTVLTRRGSTLKVNLADAGTGLAQVLPVLVQCALDEARGDGDDTPLQIIEEPEMHLHPAAHAALADLYLDTARATGTRFLIESHSETLLLRLRRRIAEGSCPPEVVAVYVVEQKQGVSTAQRVSIDELGNLGAGWPDGYFSQDYREARALAAAQLNRSGYAS